VVTTTPGVNTKPGVVTNTSWQAPLALETLSPTFMKGARRGTGESPGSAVGLTGESSQPAPTTAINMAVAHMRFMAAPWIQTPLTAFSASG
jgi:hypothetical protein